jgi:hypothetical protein
MFASSSLTITNNNMTTAQISIESELQRRFELIENSDFRLKCSKLAEQIGISAKEWNENKAAILLYFANQYCKVENELQSA